MIFCQSINRPLFDMSNILGFAISKSKSATMRNMKTLAERLADARNDKGWSKADLRRAAGLKSASTLTELESGQRTESPQLPVIAEALGVEVLWLQHGRGPKNRASPVELLPPDDLLEVARVKFRLSAGVTGYNVEPEDGNGKPVFFRKDWFETHNYKPEKLLAIKVHGQSMEGKNGGTEQAKEGIHGCRTQ